MGMAAYIDYSQQTSYYQSDSTTGTSCSTIAWTYGNNDRVYSNVTYTTTPKEPDWKVASRVAGQVKWPRKPRNIRLMNPINSGHQIKTMIPIRT